MAEENNVRALNDNLYNILLQSIKELRSDKDSEIKILYNYFQQKYNNLVDLSKDYLNKITSLQVGSLKQRGDLLNNTYFLVNGQKAVAKLTSFTNEHNERQLRDFLELQQIYEELVALVLQLPMPTVLISYSDDSGTYPLIEENFNNYTEGITNRMFFGKKSISKSNTVRLRNDFIQQQVAQKKALAKQNVIVKQNLINLTNHMNFFSGRIQEYAKKKARQSIITEAFYKHFYNIDYHNATNFYKENSIIKELIENRDEHFGGIGGMFILYHEAQGDDPTFTGQDVITDFVNVQIKSVVNKGNDNMSTFDLAKISLIENFYLFVSQIMLDTQINEEEAARAAIEFFKQENRDIKAVDAMEKYATEAGMKEFEKQIKSKLT